ncbi:DUF742 domain-containing protein [Streptomyces chiangmaiensis]|uniref:DUF742 domain-containing protein n=1 Tax=Streptomyces chiangmaiensis TaxID=766497 RepID=A0ABU7FIU0_9ACTN|nr:DUF742 domain-containing protein [Streptomyces chiangmaiensis]MED7823891.1 DUF742 domain-containing protein [Streptomyces chiangmaiensis]
MTPPRRRRRNPEAQPPPEPAAAGGGKAGEEKQPERLYILTGATDGGERASIDLVTLIVARSDPEPTATPEQAVLLRLCRAPLSVAEISAYLSLPFSVVTVLLTDLLAAELVQARAPIVRQATPDRSLLEAVMHGLQKL